LDDPQVQDAAVAIQAGYRGYKTRKELASQQQKVTTTLYNII
jgi:hypothetical protein